MAKGPDDAAIRAFRGRVRRHFRRHGRAMPWRDTRDPYRILVSEIMLQQTQVDRVRAKYGEFLAAFPDFAALDRAPLERVLAAWRGLGYNRRAVALKGIARAVVSDHRGRLPDDPDALARLPGIGPATAASICAFAFDRPVVFVETNIRRLFIHEFFQRRRSVADAELLPLVARTLPRAGIREWYYALMDLGAALAKRVPNPNRRSRHYARQPRFEGSDRQVRGRILGALLERGRMGEPSLAAAVGAEPARLRRILGEMEREGFLARRGRTVGIAPGGEGAET